MTKIKAISVAAAALMLTALGTVSAMAWHGVVLSAAQDCNTRVVSVSANDTEGFFKESGSPHSGNLVVKDSAGTKVTGIFTWSYDTTKAHSQAIGSVPLSALSVGKQYSISIEGATDVAAATVTYTACKSPACSEQLAVVGTPTLSQDGKSLTWKVHNSTGADINFLWFIKEASTSNHPPTTPGKALAGQDATVVSSVVSGSDTNTLVLTWGGATPCANSKAFSASATPAPTETASPPAAATASPSESAQAAASVEPSPPNTGGGSGGGADHSFAFVLLALVLGTVAVGGTTFALSRKGS